ncbi:uncharacterized protein A1O9_09707, partial [Exophiala aquamarina CBS 119918]
QPNGRRVMICHIKGWKFPPPGSHNPESDTDYVEAPYVFPIVGGRKVENLRSNIAALSLDLIEDDMDEVESAVPIKLG